MDDCMSPISIYAKQIDACLTKEVGISNSLPGPPAVLNKVEQMGTSQSSLGSTRQYELSSDGDKEDDSEFLTVTWKKRLKNPRSQI